MNADHYISQLLYHHNCIIVPGLGGFIANYRGALISTSKNSIYPPTKKIAFNARLTENDGLIVKHISKQENISYTEASEFIQHYVEDVLARLNSGNRITINNVGILFYDDDKSLQFYPEAYNFLTDSFGLTPVHAIQIESEQEQEEKTVPAKYEFRSIPSTEKRKHWKLTEAIPVVVLLMFMLMCPQKVRDLSSGSASVVSFKNMPSGEVNTANSEHQKTNEMMNKRIKEALGDGKHAVVIIETTIETLPAMATPDLPVAETIKENVTTNPIKVENTDVANSQEFFIIVGSFKSNENAIRFVDALKQKGYTSTIAGKRKGLFMVSCFSSATKQELDAELPKIQSALEPQAWVYKKD